MEDEVAMLLFNTVFPGIIIKVGTIFATYILNVVIRGNILKHKPNKWKVDFDIPAETVGFISIQLMTNFLGILFPTAIFFTPFLFMLYFKALKLQLTSYSLKPESVSSDESTAVIVYFLQFISYFIFLFYMIILAT